MEKPENDNRRVEPMDSAKPSKTCRLTGTGTGLAWREAQGRVYGRVRNQTEPFVLAKPGPLPGYTYPLLPIVVGRGCESMP